MTWWKADTRLQCSPRLRLIERTHGQVAAMQATLAWQAILGVNSEHGCEGLLQAIYADIGYLGSYCPLVQGDALAVAIAHLIDVQMLAQDKEPGDLRICGWDETWRATLPSTARSRLYRDRQAANRAKRGNK